ncbi:prepilin-type N-terminal cleavage/methylation domain-containing protein [Neobacillus soli]|uniref:prepilin-type N-terminal cleavage/methylation domain-containing protein n=1 Tax=Neobacillus soli TaxID=220688 RepID=UPI0008246A59|nr:prepilin-type N-terminal cleavage/methylation domain-containing protein [Neobacillus soli]
MRKFFSNQSGFTLIEVLATLVISSMLISVIFGVFNSTIKLNQKTQSHVNLRQEANIIISKLRQQHQWGEYSLCYDSLITNNKLFFEEINIKNNDIEINKSSKCQTINPSSDLNVQFKLADQQKNTFEIKTIIESKLSVAPNVNVDIKPNFYTLLPNLFIYGKQFIFQGTKVNGPNATMVIRGNLLGSDINGGAFSNVSNIYINGNANFDGGSAGLGSSTSPGNMYVNGALTLWNGTRDIYGDVYVNGKFKLKDANIYGNVFVNGDVELGWTPTIGVKSHIYYTGSLTKPANYDNTILSKVIKQDSVQGFTIPNYDIPPLKSDQWLAQNGYVNDSILGNNKKIYTNGLSTLTGSGKNMIIVSKGNININEGWSGGVTGVLYAPNGKVTFNGGSFEGLIIARDGFEVSSGGTNVSFKAISTYIKNIQDYPFVSE